MLSRINIAPALPLVALLVAFFAAPVFASNRLVDSQSPYLLQHATNPVDWYPWGEEAFAKAREENKLVFVSIGYSTCHWCHVMNRESFSDPEIAAYLNENYVCIKVDREERPDVDIVYMNFVQSLTGTGGWPLNVWLTPKKQPFFGGTYFPPRSEQGRPGFLETSQQIQSLWSADPSQIRNQSADIVQRLNRATTIEGNGSETDALELVSHAITGLFFNYDQEHGGFDPGEKFPSPTTLSFLLRASCLMTLPDEDRALARRLAVETLEAMAQGGIRDHLGGGFHRYTVDPAWRLPHFEKMLYDQALLAEVYVDAFQATGDRRFKTVATETLDYAIRDLRHPDGAFYSAEDAESADPKNPNTKREGAFYLWTEDEIDQLIREPARRALVKAHFDIRPEGNAPEGHFPTASFQGYNTPRAAVAPDQLADSHGIVPADAAVWIREAKSKLFAARQNRPRPHLDDKIITAWNGLAISALSRAAQAFDRPDYATAATEAAQFIRRELYNSESGELTRLYRDAASEVNGFAIDYACLIDGLIDLYEATADHQWLEWAHALQQTQDRLFYDEADGAYFSFTHDGENALQPLKETFDSALPAPSSLAVKNLARLAQFFDHDSYATQARKTLDVLAPLIEAEPTRLPGLLEAVPYIEGKPLQIVIAGEPEGEGAKALARVVHQQLLPHRLVLHADGGAGQAYLGQRLEFIEHVTALGGKATAYVCENFVCQLPTSDLEVLKQQLSRFHPSR